MWPVRREIRDRVSVSYKIRVLSRDAEARSLPLLENLTQETADWWPVRVLIKRYGAYCAGSWTAFGLLLLLPMWIRVLLMFQ